MKASVFSPAGLFHFKIYLRSLKINCVLLEYEEKHLFLSGIAHSHLSPASPALGVDVADSGSVLGLPHSASQLGRLLPQPLIHRLLEHSHQENEESLKIIYTYEILP